MGTSYVKINAETGGYGTGGGVPSASDTALKTMSIDFSVDRGALDEDTTDVYVTNAVYGGALKVGGSMEMLWRPTQMLAMLAALMGDSSTPYTLGEPTSCAMQIGQTVGATSRAYNFYGVGFKSVELTFESKEYVKTKWDWIASDVLDGTFDSALTFPTAEDPLIFWSATLTVTDAIPCKSISMTIDRALDEEQFVLGSFKRYQLARTGVTSISGTITTTESEANAVNTAMYGTKVATSIPATNAMGTGTLVIVANRAGGSTGVTITTPVVYTTIDTKYNGVGEIERTIEYKAVGNTFNIAVA